MTQKHANHGRAQMLRHANATLNNCEDKLTRAGIVPPGKHTNADLYRNFKNKLA